MSYLYVKAFHIIFFTSWFAGLFYLPRLFVNLAMVEDQATYQHLLLMAKKLYRFVTPIMLLTLVFGSWLIILNPALLNTGWLLTKLVIVALLIGYHFVCGNYLKRFAENCSANSHVFFRWFNEIPVIALLVIVLLATIKGF